MSRLRLYLLGPPRVELNGEPVSIDRRKAVALLTYLAVTKRTHSRDALGSRYPFVGKSRWFQDVAAKHIAAVAATLPAEVVEAAQERGRDRDLWATPQELLEELEGQLVD